MFKTRHKALPQLDEKPRKLINEMHAMVTSTKALIGNHQKNKNVKK